MKALIAALATTAAIAAAAQPMPMKPDFERGLGVSGDTAAKVESLFAKEREQRLALHEKTRAELAKILTPEQLAKFDAAGPRRGEGRGMGMGMGMGMGYGMGPGAGRGRGGGECPATQSKPEKPSA